MGTVLDAGTPDGARAYNALLGGLEPLRPDREMVARLEALHPPGVPGPKDLAIANRVYLQRAVSQAVHSGLRQVLDLGAGFPAPHLKLPGVQLLRPLHEEAKAANLGARVAYVDRDAQVVSHGLVAVRGVPGVAYTQRDLADVPSVRSCPDVTGAIIDWRFPVTVVFGLVLHFFPAAEARRIVEGYLDGLRPGSRVVITIARWRDLDLLEKVQAVYTPSTLYSHSPTQIMALFRGTSLLGNGIEVARARVEAAEREEPVRVLGGVGRV